MRLNLTAQELRLESGLRIGISAVGMPCWLHRTIAGNVFPCGYPHLGTASLRERSWDDFWGQRRDEKRTLHSHNEAAALVAPDIHKADEIVH